MCGTWIGGGSGTTDGRGNWGERSRARGDWLGLELGFGTMGWVRFLCSYLDEILIE
jgi:ribosomal protein L15